MEEPSKEEDDEEKPTGIEQKEEYEMVALSEGMNRNEKRKALKKLKRKQTRKEIAAKEREEAEARLNDPEEQKRALLMDQEEAERVERERKLFEESERAWIETMEKKMKEAAEEEQRKLLEDAHKQQQEKETEVNEDDEWEYVEEGPAEIIWQGNEIIFKKKKVRIPKKDSRHQNKWEDADKPTSNPLPPESEVFADYTNSSAASAQQVLESVAQQVPNFGTEQDKAHCPFHLKTGTCRFGQRCSRVHFYPDKSSTLLMKNMYTGPGLSWEQDEGLEACKNGSFHLRGNVYVHYKSMDSAVLAYNSINGRYFAGKQIRCEFVNLTRWKVAICGEYRKSGSKTCSHGTACNFIHCFRNPGGDYEWADADKPPPKYWVKKMAALFCYSDEHEKLMEQEGLSVPKSSSKIPKADSNRYRSRRSRSREIGEFNSSGSGRRRKREDERKWGRTHDEEICEQNTNLKSNHKGKGRTSDSDSDREWLDKEEDKGKHHTRHRKSSINRNDGDERRIHEVYSDVDSDSAPGYSKKCHRHHRKRSITRNEGDERSHEGYSDVDSDPAPGDRKKHHQPHRKHSINRNDVDERSNYEGYSGVDSEAVRGDRKKWRSSEGRSSRKGQRNNDEAGPGDWSDRDRDWKWRRKSRSSRRRSRDYGYATGSDTESGVCSLDRDGDMQTELHSSRKRSKHRRSGLWDDDYEDYEKDRQEHRHDTRKSSKHEKKSESDNDQDEKDVH